ncbi:MAG TPA: hypothetical protein PKO06_00585 [Candidatus Ozemobacteraceae bacterium]|nr:hypothetical protein [Candidatus Ozemobacteraceae bacterium]
MTLRQHVSMCLVIAVCLFLPCEKSYLKAEEESVELYYDMLESDDETVRENGVRLILAREPKNRKALENYLELEEERGNYSEAIEWLKRLEGAGVLSKDQAEERCNRLQERLANQEHISIWENRLDRFKQKEQYSLALHEVRKLKAWYSARKTKAEARMPDLNKESGEYLDSESQRKNAKYYLSLYEETEKEILERLKN